MRPRSTTTILVAMPSALEVAITSVIRAMTSASLQSPSRNWITLGSAARPAREKIRVQRHGPHRVPGQRPFRQSRSSPEPKFARAGESGMSSRNFIWQALLETCQPSRPRQEMPYAAEPHRCLQTQDTDSSAGWPRASLPPPAGRAAAPPESAGHGYRACLCRWRCRR